MRDSRMSCVFAGYSSKSGMVGNYAIIAEVANQVG